MENIILQIFFTIGSFVFLGIIIFFIRKETLSLKYSLLWLFATLVMLIVSIFPGILRYFADIFGFALSSNALFSLLFGFVIVILLSLTSIVSKQTEKIKTLVQANALLEKRVRELEKNIELV
jgi:hypothetical protein